MKIGLSDSRIIAPQLAEHSGTEQQGTNASGQQHQAQHDQDDAAGWVDQIIQNSWRM